MERSQFAFGIFTLIVGVAIGYFMYAYPEGLNPDWPLGMALVVPALFILGGLHIIADALNQTRFSHIMVRGMILGFGAIANWAAFFTTGVQCLATVSFLGLPLFSWEPSEVECRNSLRAIIAGIDLVVIAVIGLFLWHRYRASREEPGR
jgi:hypothetical protein